MGAVAGGVVGVAIVVILILIVGCVMYRQVVAINSHYSMFYIVSV